MKLRANVSMPLDKPNSQKSKSKCSKSYRFFFIKADKHNIVAPGYPMDEILYIAFIVLRSLGNTSKFIKTCKTSANHGNVYNGVEFYDDCVFRKHRTTTEECNRYQL